MQTFPGPDRTDVRDVQEATLCFLRDGDEVLLIRKKTGLGAGLYNGPGGKVEPGETPRECVLREVREEVGVALPAVEKAGELLFVFGGDPFMVVHVYRTSTYRGTPAESREADPEWVPVDAVPYDEMWPDDRHWLPEVLGGDTVRGRFWFDADGDRLEDHEVETGVSLCRPGDGTPGDAT